MTHSKDLVQVPGPGSEGASNSQLLPQQDCPSFAGDSVLDGAFKKISNSSFSGKYLVMLFYPMDWTFVCPTEIVEFSDRLEDFQACGCQVVAISTDTEFSHFQWTNTPRSQGGVGKIKIPLLSDKGGSIAKAFGCFKMDDGVAFRGLYIIDKKGKVRHLSINDMAVGRNVDEVSSQQVFVWTRQIQSLSCSMLASKNLNIYQDFQITDFFSHKLKAIDVT